MQSGSDCRTFDERHELLPFYLIPLHVDLESQKKREGHLVDLVQSARRVAEHFERHVLDDVLDPLRRNRRLERPESGTTSSRYKTICYACSSDKLTKKLTKRLNGF